MEDFNHFYGMLAMLFGFVGHILKKVVDVRKENATFQMNDYLGAYPYKTALALFLGVGAYFVLFSSDQLTYAAALTAGYMANDLGGLGSNKQMR